MIKCTVILKCNCTYYAHSTSQITHNHCVTLGFSTYKHLFPYQHLRNFQTQLNDLIIGAHVKSTVTDPKLFLKTVIESMQRRYDMVQRKHQLTTTDRKKAAVGDACVKLRNGYVNMFRT